MWDNVSSEPPIKDILTQQFALRAREGQPPAAVFTDFDGTYELPGHPGATAAAAVLTAAATEAPCPVIPVTGRSASGMIRRVEQGVLPPFPAMICSVGTDIHYLQADGSYRQDEEFARLLAAKQYDRHAIVRASQDIMAELLSVYPESQIEFQVPERETHFLEDATTQVESHKVSFFFFASELAGLARVASPFVAAFPDQQVIVCEEIGHNRTLMGAAPRRYCLDVVPVTKLDAVNYLTERFDIADGIVAGDSGNDVDVLLHSSDRLVSVLVGGHTPDAFAALETHIGAVGTDGFRRLGNKLIFVDTHPGRLAAESIVAVIRMLGRPFAMR